VAHYGSHEAPTRVERFIPRYFEDWLVQARAAEQRRMRSSNDEPATFEGFGLASQARQVREWTQWMELVNEQDEEREPRAADDEVDEE
jgi:hypothetical protein